MFVAVRLPVELAYSLLVSAFLVWSNTRGLRSLGAAGGTLGICLLIAVSQALAAGSFPPRQIEFWVLFVCVPSVAVFLVSRLSGLQARPWRLVLLGPLSFTMALVAAMVTYNILFASSRSR